MFFTETLLAIEMKKTQTYLNKRVYLGLSVLELSKILMSKIKTCLIWIQKKNR